MRSGVVIEVLILTNSHVQNFNKPNVFISVLLQDLVHTYCTLAMVHGLDHSTVGSKASTVTLRKPWCKDNVPCAHRPPEEAVMICQKTLVVCYSDIPFML